MDYVVGTIHGQRFGRIFKPERFEPTDVLHKATGIGASSVKEQAQKIANGGFRLLDQDLARHRFAAGNTFSVADAALFYVERWAPQVGIDLPPNVAAHFGRMKGRFSVQKIQGIWGET